MLGSKPIQMIILKVCINFSMELQGGGDGGGQNFPGEDTRFSVAHRWS